MVLERAVIYTFDEMPEKGSCDSFTCFEIYLAIHALIIIHGVRRGNDLRSKRLTFLV